MYKFKRKFKIDIDIFTLGIIFIFLFFIFYFASEKTFGETNYYNSDPCTSDSWKLYRNQYEDTIIVSDPYGED